MRGLLQRLRKSLPTADALALQAGAIRHPKFAPMVFLCVPTSKLIFGAAYRYYCATQQENAQIKLCWVTAGFSQ